MTVETVLETLQNAVLGIFIVMAKGSNRSYFAMIVAQSIDFFQMLGFVFYSQSDRFYWYEDYLRILFDFLEIWKMSTLVKGTSIAFFISVLGIVSLMLLNAAYVGYMYARMDFRHFWSLKLLRGKSFLVATTLFIPFLGVLLTGPTCNDSKVMSCWDGGGSILLFLFASLVILIYTGFSIAVSGSFFEYKVTQTNIEARPHAFVTLTHTCIKALLSLLFGMEHIFPTNTMYSWLLVGSVVVSYNYQYYVLWKYIPFYYEFTNLIFAGFYGLEAWGSWCLVLSFVLKDHRNPTPIICFMSALPGVVVMCVLSIRLRMNNLRIYGRNVLAQFEKDRSSIRNCWADVWDLEISIRLCLAENPTLENTRACQAIYNEMSGKFGFLPDFHVFRAQIAINYFPNWFLGQRFLTKAQELNPSLRNAFLIERISQQIKSELSGVANKQNVIQYFQVRQHKKIALEYDFLATRTYAEFWRLLQSRTAVKQKLTKLAFVMSNYSILARKEYEKYLEALGETVTVKDLLLFADFLETVGNDPARSLLYVSRANELRYRKTRIQQTDASGTLDIQNSAHGVCMIAGDTKTLGNIVEVNSMTCELFGYPKEEMVGRNVMLIVPSPFREVHDLFLTRYLDRGYGSMMNIRRDLVGLHRNGFIFPLTIEVDQYSGEGNLMFLAVIQGGNQAEKVFILTTSLSIVNLSFNCTVFQKNQSLEQLPATLLHWFPEYATHRSAIESPHGCNVEVYVAGVDEHRTLHFLSTKVICEGQVYYYLRISDEVKDNSSNFGCPLAIQGDDEVANGNSDEKGEGGSKRNIRFNEAVEEITFGGDEAVEEKIDENAPLLVNAKGPLTPQKSSLHENAKATQNENAKGPLSPKKISLHELTRSTSLELTTSEASYSSLTPTKGPKKTSLKERKAKKMSVVANEGGGDSANLFLGLSNSSQPGEHGSSQVEAAPSVSSVGSNASKRAARRLHIAIERMNSQANGIVRKLKVILYLLLMAVAAGGLTEYLTVEQILSDYRHDASVAYNVALREKFLLDIAFDTYWLMMIHQGLKSKAAIPFIYDHLGQVANSLHVVDLQLLNELDRLSDEHRLMITENSLDLFYLRGENEIITAKSSSIRAGAEFVSRALAVRSLAALNIELVGPTNPDVFFILANAEGALFHTYSQSSFLFANDSTKRMNTILSLCEILLIAVSGLSVLTFLVFVRPVVIRIDKNDDLVLNILGSIDSVTMRSILNVYRKRIQNVFSAESDEVAGNVKGAHVNSLAARQPSKSASRNAEGGKGMQTGKMSSYWQRIWTSRHKLLFRIVVLNLFCILWFFLYYEYGGRYYKSKLTDELMYVYSTASESGQMQKISMYVIAILSQSVNAFRPDVFPWQQLNQLNRLSQGKFNLSVLATYETADFVAERTKASLQSYAFGDDGIMFFDNDAVHDLMFGDACTAQPVDDVTLKKCKGFYNGLIVDFYGTMLAYIEMARRVFLSLHRQNLANVVSPVHFIVKNVTTAASEKMKNITNYGMVFEVFHDHQDPILPSSLFEDRPEDHVKRERFDLAFYRINAPEAVRVSQLNNQFLEHFVLVAVEMTQKKLTQSTQDFSTFSAIMLSSLYVFLLIAILAVVDPMIRFLSLQIKRTNAMLLTIPQDVLYKIPEVRKMFETGNQDDSNFADEQFETEQIIS